MVEDKTEVARREGQIVIYASLRGFLLSLISAYRTKHFRISVASKSAEVGRIPNLRRTLGGW